MVFYNNLNHFSTCPMNENDGEGIISHCRHALSSLAARRTHANRDGDLNDLIRGTTQLQGDHIECRTGNEEEGCTISGMVPSI